MEWPNVALTRFTAAQF